MDVEQANDMENAFSMEDWMTMLGIVQKINSSLDVDTVLNTSLEMIASLVDADASSLWLVDEPANEIYCAVATGPKAREITRVRLRRGQGIVGWVIENGKPHYTTDVNGDERHAKDIADAVGYRVQNLGCVPLQSRERTIGCIQVLNKREAAGFTNKDQMKLAAFSQLAGLAIENANLFTRLRREHEVLRRKEEQLRRFSHIIEQSPSMVVIADAEGRIQYVNPKYTEVTGYSLDEVVGEMLLELDRTDHEEADEIWEVLEAGHVWRGEFARETKTGGSYWERIAISPLRDEDGVMTNIIKVSEDISEQLELMRSKEDAENASRAKSEFLSRMSHELRTPMNSILGFAQLLQMDPQHTLTETQKQGVERILKSGRHLLDLINEILDLARIESGRLSISVEPVHIREVVEEALLIVEPMAARRQIQIMDQVSNPRNVVVKADRTRLKQILLNLLSNAIKYNREGGSVILTYEVVDGERYRISVADTGPGIPPDKLDDLFEPFNRLGAEQTEVEGTGIGLAISKRLIELMEGTIGVESEVGSGSRFYFELPLAEAVEEEAADSEEEASEDETVVEPEDDRQTVLYVEDNPANLQLVADILTLRPHIRLLSAPQARMGIDLARAHHPDLIILDINLPEMDGFEALKLLQNDPETSDIPVIALSASAMPRNVERGLRAGFKRYLTKPLNVPEFLETIDTFLETPGESAET